MVRSTIVAEIARDAVREAMAEHSGIALDDSGMSVQRAALIALRAMTPDPRAHQTLIEIPVAYVSQENTYWAAPDGFGFLHFRFTAQEILHTPYTKRKGEKRKGEKRKGEKRKRDIEESLRDVNPLVELPSPFRATAPQMAEAAHLGPRRCSRTAGLTSPTPSRSRDISDADALDVSGVKVGDSVDNMMRVGI